MANVVIASTLVESASILNVPYYNQRIVDQLSQLATSDVSTVLQANQTPMPPSAQSERDQTVIPPPPPVMSWQAAIGPSTPVSHGDQPTPLSPLTSPPSSPSPAPASRRQLGGLYIGITVLLSLLLLISLIFNFIKVGGSTQPSTFTPPTEPAGATQSSQNQEPTSPSSAATATTPPAGPTPSPTTQPASGSILCQADATHGWNGWSGSSDWKVFNGQLLNDGTNDDKSLQPTIGAPCSLGGVTNYAVEVTIQIISANNSYSDGFGITVRGDPTQNPWRGYIAAITYEGFDNSPYQARLIANDYYSFSTDGQILANVPFNPGNRSHIYRVEVKGNSLKLLIDGGQLLAVTDNRYLTTTQVGLSCFGFQLAVTSFKVIRPIKKLSWRTAAPDWRSSHAPASEPSRVAQKTASAQESVSDGQASLMDPGALPTAVGGF